MGTFTTPSGAVIDDVTGQIIQQPPPQVAALANISTPNTPTVPLVASPPPISGQTPQQPQNLAPQSLSGLIGTRPSPIDFQQTEYFNAQTSQGFSNPQILGQYLASIGRTDLSQQVSSGDFSALNQELQQSPEQINQPIQQSIIEQPDFSVMETTQLNPIDYIKDTQDIYNKAYGTLGISALKQQFNDYNKQLLDLRNEKTEATMAINDDPFLTEGLRKGRVAKLDEKYQQKETNLLAFLQLSQSLYETGLQQAQFLTNAALNQYQDERDFQQQLQLNTIQQSQKMADARFQIANGQPFYKYEGADLVYDTKTGKPISYADYQSLGGVGKPGQRFADVFEIQKNKTAEQTLVLDLAQKYPDAGIGIRDSLQIAQSKIPKSKIYQEAITKGSYELSTDAMGNTVIFDKNTGKFVNGNVSGVPATTNDTDAIAIRNSFNALGPRLSKDQKNSGLQILNQYLAKGDIEGAKQFIMSSAIAALPTEQQNAAFGRFQAIDALNNIEQSLSEYQNAGGNTNLLTGSFEKITQKLGETSDPTLAAIGNKITLAMIAYRRSVSGAAFTEPERKQYDALFPSISGNIELNTAKIQSLRETFDLHQKSVMSTVLGPRNYEALTASSGSVGAGSIIFYGGRQYQTDAQGNFDPSKPLNNNIPYDKNKLSSFKQSIIQQESGGRYDAIGSQTAYGRALGKYQIIPKFHFGKIGLNPNLEADKQRFLKTPKLQDQLFAKIIDGLAARYKDFQKIAAAYYGGAAGANKVGTRAGDRRQGKFPSINEYVASVLSRMS